MKKSEIINSWTPQEQWVWDELILGRIADFNIRYKEQLDPAKQKGWLTKTKSRVISQKFLEDILLLDFFKTDIGNRGLRLEGAYFPDTLNLENLRLDHQLWLDHCRFQSDANFDGITVNEWFSIEGSFFKKKLNLQGANVKGANLMISVKGNANLSNTKIGGDVYMDGVKFYGSVHMNSLEILGDLLITKGLFCGHTDLTYSRVKGQIDMTGSKFQKGIDMHSIAISKLLFLRKISVNEKINLSSAIIKGQLDISESSFKGDIDMHSIAIGQNLFLSKIKKCQKVILNAAKILGKIEITDLKLSETLLLNDAQIDADVLISQAFFNTIDIAFVKIGGAFGIEECRLINSINMHAIEIGKDLNFIENEMFSEVLLTNSSIHGDVNIEENVIHNNLNGSHTKIGGSLYLLGCEIRGNLDFFSASIDQGFEFSNNNCLGVLILTDSKIGSNVVLWNSNIEGSHLESQVFEESDDNDHEFPDTNEIDHDLPDSSVNMNFCKVGGAIRIVNGSFDLPVQIHGAEIQKDVIIQTDDFILAIDFSFTSIGANLQCSNQLLINQLNLEEAKVGGNLLLFESNFTEIILRGTELQGLLEFDPWGHTTYVEMQGLTFKTANFSFEEDVSTKERKINSLQWLNLDPNYHPQPYEELALYNKKIGYPAISDRIQFKSKERRRKQAFNNGEYGSWIGLALSKTIIGYGLGTGYFWALGWFFVLTLIGWVVIGLTDAGSAIEMTRAFWASFDNALPLIELNKEHQSILYDQPNKFVASFFYMQKLLGYVLGGFIVAGLSGLTQKGR